MISQFLLQSGSPLDARTTLPVFKLLVIGGIIAIVIGILYLVSKYIFSYRNSEAYMERKKNKPSTLADINELGKLASMTKEEKNILWDVIKDNKSPNILFSIKDFDFMESLFKEKYDALNEANDEENKTILFSLRKKVLKTFKQQIIIKNSKGIESTTVFTYTAKKGFHHKLVLRENTPEGLILSMPSSLQGSDEKPAPLSKILFVFEAKGGYPYEFDTRVVRYQSVKQNEEQMIVVHTDRILPLQKRMSERYELDKPCKFSSVNVTPDASKKGKLNYIPADKEYEGVLADISTGGCRITTNLPIKAEQYIYIKGCFNGKIEDTAIGAIVRTTKRSDNIYILHIKFLKIAPAAVNRIEALVCGYELLD